MKFIPKWGRSSETVSTPAPQTAFPGGPLYESLGNGRGVVFVPVGSTVSLRSTVHDILDVRVGADRARVAAAVGAVVAKLSAAHPDLDVKGHLSGPGATMVPVLVAAYPRGSNVHVSFPRDGLDESKVIITPGVQDGSRVNCDSIEVLVPGPESIGPTRDGVPPGIVYRGSGLVPTASDSRGVYFAGRLPPQDPKLGEAIGDAGELLRISGSWEIQPPVYRTGIENVLEQISKVPLANEVSFPVVASQKPSAPAA